MEIKLAGVPLTEVEADVLVLPVAEGAQPSAAQDVFSELAGSGEFSGKPLEASLVHRPQGLRAKRVLFAGAGKAQPLQPADMRKLAGAAVRFLKAKGARKIAIAADGADGVVSAAVEGALLGSFEPDRYKTDPKKTEKVIDQLLIVGAGATREAVERGRVLAEAQNYARDLVNEPGNLLTPVKLGERALQLASESGLECEVLDEARLRELGMGSLLGVAQGSAEPPVLIVLRYRPAQASASQDHLALIGKGVTFDTGGISIKPAEGMEKMKYDMAGAAAVLGAMRAIAERKPKIPVTALIPSVENMPGSRAQRPGDVVTSLAGKTIEVLNTDAEGRLILIDALTYAQRLGCTHMVDAATLTGAIVVALGHFHIGAFTNDLPFLDRLLAAARQEGEKMWPMPLDDEYRELLNTPFADIQNIGTRWGGAITAAMFLKEWVEGNRPWVHLDIAGTAWLDEAKAWMAKGPTGVCVRSFVTLAENWV